MKIAVIGGAGVRTVIFINGLLRRYKKLNIDEVSLFDINKEKLDIIGKLCMYVVEREKKDLRITLCDTCEGAVAGTDYIVTTLRVGGDHSRVQDERAALNAGVIGQETTGAGGFSMAARTIPVLLDYCRIFQKYAPDAWIFNFSNPSGLVTQALTQAGYDKVIGICDAPSATKFRMAERLGVEEDELYVEFFGLNHLSWISSVKKKGKEILSELVNDEIFLDSMQEFKTMDPEAIRSSKMLPNEYLYYYYHREKALEHILNSENTRGESSTRALMPFCASHSGVMWVTSLKTYSGVMSIIVLPICSMLALSVCSRCSHPPLPLGELSPQVTERARPFSLK